MKESSNVRPPLREILKQKLVKKYEAELGERLRRKGIDIPMARGEKEKES